MAQQYVDPNFGTLVVPQAVAGYTVAPANAGLAANGIVMLVGEADAGPDYTLETNGVAGGPIDLSGNSFGPDQLSDVVAKYGSGPIVDAMRNLVAPSNDPQITGAPAAFVIAKTNVSTQATASLLGFSGAAFATLGALQRGQGGNNVSAAVAVPGSSSSVQAQAEAVPSVKFTALAGTGTVYGALRVNGGAAETFSWDGSATIVLPPAMVTALSLTGVTVQGGAQTSMLSGAGVAMAFAATGNALTITLSASTFSIQAGVGDMLYIPHGGTIASAAGNTSLAGSYVVTAANAAKTSITATKLLDATPGTTATLTPVSVGTTPVSSAAATDLLDFAPVILSQDASGTTVAVGSNGAALPQATINVASTTGFPSSGSATVQTSAAGAQVFTYTGVTGTAFTGCSGGTGTLSTGGAVTNPLAGIGRSLEVADGVSAQTDSLTNLFYALNTSKVTWVSASGAPALIASAQEYVAEVDTSNQTTATSEALVAGGEIGLQLGFSGATAQVVNNGTTLTFTLSTGTLGPLQLSNFKTISQLAAYLAAQPNFTAAVGTGITGSLPPTALDQGTFTFGTSWGAKALRWKVDAYRFATRGIASSSLVQLNTPLPKSGLPMPQAAVFLSGGARGGSSDANITGAMDALQNVIGNFLVPLFSQNASLDIAVGTTDPSSTYDIASINAYAKTHVLLMSQPKRRRARQALLGIRDTFANAQAAASNLASFRCAMTFQDVIATGGTGALTQFQPWLGAGLAASMQAAGFYRGIVQKLLNVSGAVQAAGDYNDQNLSQETTALQAGLLPMKRDLASGGGVSFISDQTTYGTDSNFVYNSIQAVYIADVMAATLAQRMQRAFVGQSVADISASMAVAYVKNILTDFLTLKLIAPSDGAPKGYQPGSIHVKISGTVMTVKMNLFLAGLLYFVPIEFQLNQVQQSASA